MTDPTRPPPSAAAYAIASAILGVLVGFYIGQASSLGLFNSSSVPALSKTIALPAGSGSDYEDSDDEDANQEVLGALVSKEEYKLVLVVRTDLGMTKGKIAAQCSHATLACYKTLLKSSMSVQESLRRWERQGQAKIAVQISSEDELNELQARAMSLGLCAQVVRDAGRTQIAAGSATVLGIGPGPKSVVDQVTGSLKLL